MAAAQRDIRAFENEQAQPAAAQPLMPPATPQMPAALGLGAPEAPAAPTATLTAPQSGPGGTVGLGAQLPKIITSSQAMDQAVQGILTGQKALNERLQPLQSQVEARRGVVQGELDKPLPEAPKLNDIPQFQPRQLSGQELSLFGGIAMALAGLGTKAMRGDITVALTAAGNAMKGYNEGNLQQSKLDMEQFKQRMDAVIAENHKMSEEYRGILENRKLSMLQKEQSLKVAAAARDDQVMLSALSQGQFKMVFDLEAHRINASNQAAIQSAQIYNTAQWHSATLQMQRDRVAAQYGTNPGGGGLRPEAVDMLAREAIKDKGVLANLGRGVQGARDLQAITNRMAEIMAAEGGPGLVQRRAEVRADSNSLNKMTTSYDAIVAFEQTAVRNGRMLVDLANKVDQTGVPVIERWTRAGRAAVAGDPEVSQFNAQMQVYRTEAARILTNPNLTGQLTDSARHEVEHFLSGSDSAQQISAVVTLLERDFDNRKHTLEKQMDAARDRMMRGYGAGAQPGGGAASALPPEGTAGTSKSGRATVVRGGQWVYQ